MTTPVVQDGNASGLAIAEETTIGVLPVTPVWYAYEVNSYSDFGGDPTLVTRSILGTRKKQKGSITGIAPKSGFNIDFTRTNMLRQLQGFFFANWAEKATTLPLNGSQTVITSVASGDSSYNAASGLGSFAANSLMLAAGFTNAANNGLKTVVTDATAKITVSQTLVSEASPPAAAYVRIVGFQFTSGDATMNYTAPVLTLGDTTKDLTTLGLGVGEWIYIGGDGAAFNFATAGLNGYARVASIATHAITFDKFSGTPASDTGTSKTIQIFFGSTLQDQPASTSVRHTFTHELQLGNDGNGIQTQQVNGVVNNELTLNVPKKDKLSVDLACIGLNSQQFSGSVGLATGTRVAAPGEDALNTSSDIVRLRLSVFDGTTLLPVGFGYCTTETLKISNNASLNEAVGTVGGFEVNVGDFEVTGSAELYFTTIAAIAAIRAKSQCSLDLIAAQFNTAWVWDLPFVELSGGLAKIEKNKPIMLPVNKSVVQNVNGYTLLADYFPYAPTQAMPTTTAQI